jgi:hypothetical protein
LLVAIYKRQLKMDKITTTIKREWLAKIANRTKRIEYRELKPYWVKRLSRVQVPFLLRLINGMHANAPEITVIVTKVRKNSRSRQFELVLGKIVELKYWSVKFERPTSRV